MKLAVALLAGALTLAPLQDDWKPLALTAVEPPPDSAAAVVGLSLTPAPGAIDLVIGVDNPCQAKITATQQPHGAVVKVRLIGPPADRKCPGQKIETYKASVTGLKKKQYQVIVYTADAKNRWHPWKAGVTDVP
jgi:hypothetical protein